MLGRLRKTFDLNNRQFKSTDEKFKKIKELGPKVQKMPYEEIRNRVSEMREELKILVDAIPESEKTSLTKIERTKDLPEHELEVKKKLMSFLPEIYAFVDEIFRRKDGRVFHDVQLRAAILLAEGQRLVEMKTGEGKTQTFALPLFLYALTGRGSHLTTVNDYLTKVGGEYIGHMASEMGLSVGIIAPDISYKFIHDDEIEKYKGEEGVKARKDQKIQIDNMVGVNLIECTKRQAYECDITYGTNNEFGFDYLRDNMAWELERLAQRELYFCIIDEADSILIDEARTPLIISGVPSESDTEKYSRFASAVASLNEEEDYIIEHKGGENVALTEEGISKVEDYLEVDNLWSDYSMAFHIENALKAKALFKKDEKYIVKNGEVLIVDDFTGRVMKGRRYSEGLHQAIEAKEKVNIKQESKTFATITFQNFFRLYKVLCGGSGTIMTEAEEFYKIYGLESTEIPTNKPNIREDHSDKIFKTEHEKFRAVVAEIKEKNEKGQPVLIGTASVDKSEILSKLLDAENIPHEVLNAKYHEQESRIVAQAGKKGAVTVATNMAGRGTDIVLGGGTRGDEEWEEIVKLGGLHVVGTERHEARRIDNQLRGRSGRQGEPGSTRFYVALNDQIMKVLGGELIARLMSMVKVPDDTPIELGMISKQIETAQKRIEGSNFDSRKRIVEYDDVMNQHREIYYSRRSDFLETTEHAMGKFIIDSEIKNLQLPENAEIKNEYEETIKMNQEELKQVVGEMVDDQIDNIMNEVLTEVTGNKVKGSHIEKIIDKLRLIIPDPVLSRHLGSNPNVKEDLQEKFSPFQKFEELEKELKILADDIYKSKVEEFNEDFYNIAKIISFRTMDERWVDHLEIMTDLRHGIGLRGYAQKDPLVEYKNESYEIFDSFVKNIDTDITKQLFRLRRVQRVENVRQPQNLQTNEANVKDVSTGTREMTPEVRKMIESRKTQAFQKKMSREEARELLKKSRKKRR